MKPGTRIPADQTVAGQRIVVANRITEDTLLVSKGQDRPGYVRAWGNLSEPVYIAGDCQVIIISNEFADLGKE